MYSKLRTDNPRREKRMKSGLRTPSLVSDTSSWMTSRKLCVIFSLSSYKIRTILPLFFHFVYVNLIILKLDTFLHVFKCYEAVCIPLEQSYPVFLSLLPALCSSPSSYNSPSWHRTKNCTNPISSTIWKKYWGSLGAATEWKPFLPLFASLMPLLPCMYKTRAPSVPGWFCEIMAIITCFMLLASFMDGLQNSLKTSIHSHNMPGR